MKLINNLGVEIKEYYDQTLKSLNTGLFKYEKNLNLINNNINITLAKVFILTGIKYLNVVNSPLVIFSSISMMIGAGPIGIVVGMLELD